MKRSAAPRRIASFIVRMWTEPTSGVGTSWRGQIEHLQSGERRNFVELIHIAEFIADRLAAEEDRPMIG